MTDDILLPDILLAEMVRSMVDDPSGVKITSKESDNTTLLTIEVLKDDVGKVLGKGGANIRLLEKFMQIVYAVEGRRAYVEVGGSSRKRQ